MSRKAVILFSLVLLAVSHSFGSLFCHARDITKPLEVEFFSQKDSQWGCDQLGSCFNSSKCNTGTVEYSTIYQFGCFLTSKAMVFNFHKPGYTNPGALNDCLKNNGGYSQDEKDVGTSTSGGYCLMNWGNDKQSTACIPEGVCYIGSFAGDVNALSSTIDAELSSGYPVLADVRYGTTSCENIGKQHMVVIVGKSGLTYEIKDPLYGTDTTGLDNGALNTWYHLCNIHVYRYFKVNDRVTATTDVNIREGTSTASRKKCTAEYGDIGTIIGGPEHTSDSNYTWWEIRWDSGTGDCAEGTTGWSVANYLRRVFEEDTTTTNTITHNLTPPSNTTIFNGGILGPITIEETNNSDAYYEFYIQPYVIKPDGTTLYFRKLSSGLNAGKTRKICGFLCIPSSSELGVFTFGAKLTDTDGNLIDDDSFEFTVVSGSTYASKRTARRLKRLMRNPEVQVIEDDGWKVIIVPERNM